MPLSSTKVLVKPNGVAGTEAKSSSNYVYCCFPDGCDRYRSEPIFFDEPGNAVRVICSNESCPEGTWMHASCFNRWENQVLSFLGSCGRARSWSDKQRQQNIWTKKGYDLAYKACNCKCGRGHLRKDVEHMPSVADKNVEDKKNRKLRRKSESSATVAVVTKGPVVATKTAAGMPGTALSPSVAINWSGNGGRPPLRVRTSSLSSTGSNGSPPSSADTPPLTGSTGGSSGWHFGSGKGSYGAGGTPSSLGSKFDFFADAEQAALGCIFKRRNDYSMFSSLPRWHQNPYHIKMEDEGPHGNDETRCFVLTNLSSHKVTEMQCVVCSLRLQVYDKYPLVDGSFFLSPLRYNSTVQVQYDGKSLHLNAVCMHCMYGTFRELRCRACRTAWSGRFLLIGTMYAYDVFAAVPCCSYRAACKNCQKQVVEGGAALPFFSDYSRRLQCPHCKADDCHFVKQLDDVFAIRGSR